MAQKAPLVPKVNIVPPVPVENMPTNYIHVHTHMAQRVTLVTLVYMVPRERIAKHNIHTYVDSFLCTKIGHLQPNPSAPPPPPPP